MAMLDDVRINMTEEALEACRQFRWEIIDFLDIHDLHGIERPEFEMMRRQCYLLDLLIFIGLKPWSEEEQQAIEDITQYLVDNPLFDEND